MSKFVLSAFADEIEMDLNIQMDILEECGINHIEMRGVNGKGLVEHSLEEVKKIKQELDKRNFKISAVGSPIGKIQITDDFAPDLELFKHTLEIAKILEAKYIRMFSFFIPEGEEPAKYRDEVMKRWRKYLEVSEGIDVTLLHENEKEIYGDTPERCLDIYNTMNSDRLKLIFDPANFIQCDVKTYPEAFEMLKDHVVYFHVKDALYENHKVVPAGFGDGHLEEILKEEKEKGFEGFLSLEPHLGNFKGFAELENSDCNDEVEDNGTAKFKVACNALKDILNKL